MPIIHGIALQEWCAIEMHLSPSNFRPPTIPLEVGVPDDGGPALIQEAMVAGSEVAKSRLVVGLTIIARRSG